MRRRVILMIIIFSIYFIIPTRGKKKTETKRNTRTIVRPFNRGDGGIATRAEGRGVTGGAGEREKDTGRGAETQRLGESEKEGRIHRKIKK